MKIPDRSEYSFASQDDDLHNYMLHLSYNILALTI